MCNNDIQVDLSPGELEMIQVMISYMTRERTEEAIDKYASDIHPQAAYYILSDLNKKIEEKEKGKNETN